MTISLRNRSEWMFLLAVGLGGACVVWGLSSSVDEQIRKNLNYIGLSMLAVSALAAVYTYRRSHRRLLDRLHRQLEHAQGDEIGQLLVDRIGESDECVRPVNRSLVAVCKQMDEIKRTNRALTVRAHLADTQREKIEHVLALVSDAVLVTNRFDELVFANEPAEFLLNFRLVNSARKNIDQVLSDGALVRLIREARQQGLNQPRQVVEHTFDSNQSPHTFRITLSCVPGPGRTLSAIVVILQDVTREKQIEQSKTEFVSNVSHELKTPLSSIKAYTEMLLDGEVEEGQNTRDFYETIGGEADRLHRLIDRILNISRIESGGVRVVREPVSMTAVVKQVIRVVAPQARAKNIRITEHLSPVYYQVEADYDLICQAVENLLSNAVKYTLPDGSVDVRVTVDERRGAALVEVSDTGIGIPPEELPKIFEKFYRVRANKKMASGTGLGLPLVKYIVETIHDGKLSVTSEVGVGSTFSFELPLVS